MPRWPSGGCRLMRILRACILDGKDAGGGGGGGVWCGGGPVWFGKEGVRMRMAVAATAVSRLEATL